MVRPRPDIDENQRPEVNDGKSVGIHRPVGGFRQEVIHHAEIRRGQKERDGVVAVPPLHQGFLHARKQRITLRKRYGQFETAHNVQHGDRHPGSDVEPNRYVQVIFPAGEDRAEHINPEHHPNECDQNIEWPDQFGVFTAGRKAHRQRHCRTGDDHLPSPEVYPGKFVAPHTRFQQALQRIINTHKQAVADKSKNYGIGVQRAQATEGEPGAQIE